MAVYHLQSNMADESMELDDVQPSVPGRSTDNEDAETSFIDPAGIVDGTTETGIQSGGGTTDVTPVGPLTLSLQGQVRQTALDTVYKKWGRNAGGPPSGGRFPDNFVYTEENGLRLKNYPKIRLINPLNDEPLALSTIARGIGVKAVRKELGFAEYGVKLPAEDTTAMQKSSDNLGALNTKAGTAKTQELPAIAEQASDAVKTLETALRDAGVRHSLREILALDKMLQTIRGELANNLAKLTELDNHITREQNKLNDPDIVDFERQRITERIRDLKDERVARLEAASASRGALRSQISRIRETITRLINEDTTLAERIQTLFREQGITIVSILTALGMVISTLVLAISGGSAAVVPTPPSKGGLREWVKKYLHALGRVLAKLAAKAGAALPGIIGSVVGWLLNHLSKTAGWLASNLWALMLAVGSILLITAREWLTKR